MRWGNAVLGRPFLKSERGLGQTTVSNAAGRWWYLGLGEGVNGERDQAEGWEGGLAPVCEEIREEGLDEGPPVAVGGVEGLGVRRQVLIDVGVLHQRHGPSRFPRLVDGRRGGPVSRRVRGVQRGQRRGSLGHAVGAGGEERATGVLRGYGEGGESRGARGVPGASSCQAAALSPG